MPFRPPLSLTVALLLRAAAVTFLIAPVAAGRLIRALLCGADAMDLHSIIDAPSYGAFSLGLTDFDCLN